MTVCAFMYDDYYCWSVYRNYKGVYNDEEELLKSLIGGRESNQNLEIMNLESLGSKVYKWVSLYESCHDYFYPNYPSTEETSLEGQEIYYWLEEKWPINGKKQKIIYEDENPSEFNNYDKMGYWEQVKNV